MAWHNLFLPLVEHCLCSESTFLFPFLILGVIMTLLAMGGAISLLGETRRRAAVASIAEQLGLSFVEDGGTGLLSELSDLPLFSRGRSKRITNLIQGETDEVMHGGFRLSLHNRQRQEFPHRPTNGGVLPITWQEPPAIRTEAAEFSPRDPQDVRLPGHRLPVASEVLQDVCSAWNP